MKSYIARFCALHPSFLGHLLLCVTFGRVANQKAMKSSSAKQILSHGERHFASVGMGLLRFTLVLLLLWFGLLKFTAAEAGGVQPLIAASPLIAWMYHVLSVQGVSDVIGVIEIGCALLIASRRFSPFLSAAGSLGAIFTFLVTLSFLFTTPGAFQHVPGVVLPFPSLVGSFLVKDLALLAASFSTAAEALAARRLRTRQLPGSDHLATAGAVAHF